MQTESIDGVTVIHLKDPLERGIVDKIESEIVKTIVSAGTRKLVLNLEHVNHFHTAGIRLLLSTNRNIRQLNGRLTLAGLQSYTHRILKAIELWNMFEVYPTTADAVASFKQ